MVFQSLQVYKFTSDAPDEYYDCSTHEVIYPQSINRGFDHSLKWLTRRDNNSSTYKFNHSWYKYKFDNWKACIYQTGAGAEWGDGSCVIENSSAVITRCLRVGRWEIWRVARRCLSCFRSLLYHEFLGQETRIPIQYEFQIFSKGRDFETQTRSSFSLRSWWLPIVQFMRFVTFPIWNGADLPRTAPGVGVTLSDIWFIRRRWKQLWEYDFKLRILRRRRIWIDKKSQNESKCMRILQM